MKLSFWDLCWPLVSLGLGFPSFTVGWALWCLHLYVHTCPQPCPWLSWYQWPSEQQSWSSKGAARCTVSLSSGPVSCRGPRGQQSQPQLAGVGWAGRRPRAVLGIAPHPSAQRCGHMACTPPTGLLLYAALCSMYPPRPPLLFAREEQLCQAAREQAVRRVLVCGSSC